MGTKLRAAEPDEIEWLLAMMEALWAHDGIPFDRERSRLAALQLMGDPSAGTLWIIEADRQPAGYLVLTRSFSLEFEGWHAFIDELFLAPKYRGRGLGTAAIQEAMAECADRGMNALLLEADLANESATRLYRRLGFREHSRRLMSVRLSPGSD